MQYKKVILIDANNLAYRAFYALPQTIATSTGQVTNAVLGFTTMLLKLMVEQNPDKIICAFDSKGMTFRHEAYEKYKATRKKMPEELANQMSLIKEVAGAFNINAIEIEGFEADDIIATLVKGLKDKFKEIIIVSGDKDMLQLVSGSVKVWSIRKGVTDIIVYDPKKVKEKFGLEAGQIKDFLALTGDISDNIPGIPGIGPKTAKDLVEKYDDIDGIFKNLDSIKSEKLKNLLIKEEQNARMSLNLAILKESLEINYDDLKKKSLEEIEYLQAEDLFKSLEFNSLKKRLEEVKKIYKGPVKQNFKHPEKQARPINSADKLKLNLYINEIDDGKIATEKEKSIYMHYFEKVSLPGPESSDHAGPGNKGNISGNTSGYIILFDGLNNIYFFDKEALLDKTLLADLSRITSNKAVIKSGFDFKKIFKFFFKYGISLEGCINDYKIQYLLINSGKTDAIISDVFSEIGAGSVLKDHVTEDIPALELIPVSENTQYYLEQFEELHKSKQMDFDFYPSGEKQVIDLESIKNMLLKCRILSFAEIESALSGKIKSEGLSKLYNEIESPLIKVLAYMEYMGVSVDSEYLKKLIKEYDYDIINLKKTIHELCGQDFNINSTQQLAKILYDKLKLSATKKTKTGFSTDAATLISIYDSHPVIEKILDYREKVKLKNTYIDVLPNLIDPGDKRIHTTYNQLGTTTGRISSNNPNLQNIPVRTEMGRQLRKAFIPDTGYDLILSADYSQVELRILAHLSGDKDLIDAFKSGKDIHTKTASEIFGIKYDEVNEDQRRKAKAINFGIIYGMTEFGLKNRLSISEEEARQYIDLYFSRYPGVKQYINNLVKTAYKTGFATTMFGRKRYLGELASTNAHIRNLGERLAVNTPIQGTAADIMKLATVILFDRINKQKIDCNIILHVHDEIVLELKEADLDRVKDIVTDSMENCVDIKTGLRVEIKTGKNWFI